MITSKLKEIAREQRWYVTGSTVFGPYREYLVSVTDGQGFKMLELHLHEANSSAADAARAALIPLKKDLGFAEVVVHPHGIAIKVAESYRSTKKDKLYAILDRMVEAASRLHLPSSLVCASCQTAHGLSYYTLNGAGTLFCGSCQAKMRDDFLLANDQYANEDKDYLKGGAGAMLFCLPGILAWVAMAFYLERIGAFMALVFSFLALKGYDHLGAKRGRFTPIVIGLVSLVSVVASVGATILFALLKRGRTWAQAATDMATNPKISHLGLRELTVALFLCGMVWVFQLPAMWKGHRKLASLEPAVPMG